MIYLESWKMKKFRALGLDGKMYDNAIEIGVGEDDMAYLVARLPETCGIKRFLQWAGRKDKKGKEMHEGDLLTNPLIKDRFLPYVIKFGEHSDIAEAGCTRHSNIGFYMQDATGGQVGLLNEELLLDWGGFEVIGNIYSNEELLEK